MALFGTIKHLPQGACEDVQAWIRACTSRSGFFFSFFAPLSFFFHKKKRKKLEKRYIDKVKHFIKREDLKTLVFVNFSIAMVRY